MQMFQRKPKPRQMPRDTGVVMVPYTPIEDRTVVIAAMREDAPAVMKVRELEAYHARGE